MTQPAAYAMYWAFLVVCFVLGILILKNYSLSKKVGYWKNRAQYFEREWDCQLRESNVMEDKLKKEMLLTRHYAREIDILEKLLNKKKGNSK
jgi:hypothetical protein